MRIQRFAWDLWNTEHIARHDMTEEEAESVFLLRPMIRSIGDERYTAHGLTLEGRYVLVVFERLYEGEVSVITARNMTAREQKNFRKRRRR